MLQMNLASCWYGLLTKQHVFTGVKIKVTGNSKLNDSPEPGVGCTVYKTEDFLFLLNYP